MNTNLLPTDSIALVDAIDPASHGVGDVSTGWIDAKTASWFMGVVNTGVLGASATLDAKFEQAQDASGTGAKDITGKAITQLTKAGADDLKQVIISVNQEDLDKETLTAPVVAGFTHVRLTLTVGTAASLAGANLFAVGPREFPASDANATTVAEIV